MDQAFHEYDVGVALSYGGKNGFIVRRPRNTSIAVNDGFFVSGAKPPGNLRSNFYGLTLRKRTWAQPLAQSFTLEKLGDDEGQAVVCADIKDGQDVGMLDLSYGAGFAVKSSAAVRIGGKIIRQDFQGDVAREAESRAR